MCGWNKSYMKVYRVKCSMFAGVFKHEFDTGVKLHYGSSFIAPGKTRV